MTERKQIMSRKEARALGLKRYFTGKPCPHGHHADRWVSSGACYECVRLKAPGVVKRWRQAKDPDELKALDNARSKHWRQRHPEAARAIKKRHYESHLEEVRAYARDWRVRNRDRAVANDQERYWSDLENQRKRGLLTATRWAAENPEKSAALKRHHRARRRGAEGSHTVEELVKLLDDQGGICAAPDCDRAISKKYTVDHKIPLVRGGSNDISNLQLLCSSCNSSKGNRTTEEWLSTRRFRGPPTRPDPLATGSGPA